MQLHYYKLTVYKLFSDKHISVLVAHSPKSEWFVTFKFDVLCPTMLLIATDYSFAAGLHTKHGFCCSSASQSIEWANICPRTSLVAITHVLSEIEQKIMLGVEERERLHCQKLQVLKLPEH